MNTNRRDSFRAMINRHNLFVLSKQFDESSEIELQERLRSVRESFEHFREEHLTIIEKILVKETFNEQERAFNDVEETYRHVCVEIQSKLDKFKVVFSENVRSNEHANENSAKSTTENIDLRERLSERRVQSAIQVRHTLNRRLTCNNCGAMHQMHRCERFLRLSIYQRRERVRQKELCPNCFMPDNRLTVHRCRFGVCKRCNKNEYHNSLLCYSQNR